MAHAGRAYANGGGEIGCWDKPEESAAEARVGLAAYEQQKEKGRIGK
jgi:hypothetical protein